MRQFLVSVLLLVAAMGRADEAATSGLLTAMRAEHGFVAIGLAWQQGPDGIPHVLQSGTTQAGGDQALPDDAAWHLGSITKGFTATLIMMLAEEGVLDLDAPLSEVLPDRGLHPEWGALTLTQLLSHTAGLPPDLPALLLLGRPTHDLPALRARALAALWADPLPGSVGQVAYSNVGPTLASHLAEEATGQAWEVLVQDRIAVPLGLASLGFGAPQDGPGNVVAIRGHQEGAGGTLVPVDPASPFADNSALMAPAGAIHLSLADLLAWGRFQLDACRGLRPDLLSAEGCLRLHRVVADPMALGFIHFGLPGRVEPIIGHDGSNTLWYAFLMLFPEQDLVLAVTMNDGRPEQATEAAVALATQVLSLAP